VVLNPIAEDLGGMPLRLKVMAMQALLPHGAN
jgi:hypothetical protein